MTSPFYPTGDQILCSASNHLNVLHVLFCSVLSRKDPENGLFRFCCCCYFIKVLQRLSVAFHLEKTLNFVCTLSCFVFFSFCLEYAMYANGSCVTINDNSNNNNKMLF